jgi:hypothetical protein
VGPISVAKRSSTALSIAWFRMEVNGTEHSMIKNDGTEYSVTRNGIQYRWGMDNIREPNQSFG